MINYSYYAAMYLKYFVSFYLISVHTLRKLDYEVEDIFQSSLPVGMPENVSVNG